MKQDQLDMTTLLALLDEVREIARGLDGKRLNVEGSNNKEFMRQKSTTSKNLLYVAHLADTVRLEAMNQYHRFKGDEPPTITT